MTTVSYLHITYGTAQKQVVGLARVRVLTLEYLRTNMYTCVENAGARHKHNTTAQVMSLNL